VYVTRLAIVLAACGFVYAQTHANKGSIGGFISNASGSPISHAKVQVTNGATGLEREGKPTARDFIRSKRSIRESTTYTLNPGAQEHP
jgi:hypothetical protein